MVLCRCNKGTPYPWAIVTLICLFFFLCSAFLYMQELWWSWSQPAASTPATLIASSLSSCARFRRWYGNTWAHRPTLELQRPAQVSNPIAKATCQIAIVNRYRTPDHLNNAESILISGCLRAAALSWYALACQGRIKGKPALSAGLFLSTPPAGAVFCSRVTRTHKRSHAYDWYPLSLLCSEAMNLNVTQKC